MNGLLDNQPSAWRFTGTSSALGRVAEEGDGFALMIAHDTYQEGSWWEQRLSPVVPGTLLTLSGAARTQGGCWKKISADRMMAGTKIALEAFAREENGETVSLGVVEHLFFPPTNPDNTVQENVRMVGSLRLVVPEGTEFVTARAELSGEGVAAFSEFGLTTELVDAERMNDALVDRLKESGTIRSPALENAFRGVARHHFLPQFNWGRVYQDEAIATHYADGTEVSISASSQPTIMALMLEQLEAAPGMRVLEIGAGTGYNAALLAQLTRPGGAVWAIDVEEMFCAEARSHLALAEITDVTVVCADGWGGWPEAAPYDRIMVTANAHDLAPAWQEQLRDGGRLVLPWGAPNASQRSAAFRKEGNRLIMESLHFCGFMEMRGAHRWSPPPIEGPSRDWQNWLFPGQPPGDPAGLIAYPLGSAPALKAGEYLIRLEWFEYVASWD